MTFNPVLGQLTTLALSTKLVVDDPAGGYVTAQQLADLLETEVLNGQIGTSYTAALSDRGKVVTRSNAAAQTFTVPPNSSVAFPLGTVLTVIQTGAGLLTLVPGSGVTINKPSTNSLASAGQHSVIQLLKTGTDTWQAMGSLGAA